MSEEAWNTDKNFWTLIIFYRVHGLPKFLVILSFGVLGLIKLFFPASLLPVPHIKDNFRDISKTFSDRHAAGDQDDVLGVLWEFLKLLMHSLANDLRLIYVRSFYA